MDGWMVVLFLYLLRAVMSILLSTVTLKAWNPAEDRQAVDRAYRIGQTKPVVVYRLIMASSVEEKMYEKQVFKDGVRVVTESGVSSSTRYFSQDETTELFTLGPTGQSLVMERLWKASNSSMREVSDTRGSLKGVLGYSRHDTLYSEIRPTSIAVDEDVDTADVDPTNDVNKRGNAYDDDDNTNDDNEQCDEASCTEEITTKQTHRKVIDLLPPYTR
jgi:hypothetical protein